MMVQSLYGEINLEEKPDSFMKSTNTTVLVVLSGLYTTYNINLFDPNTEGILIKCYSFSTLFQMFLVSVTEQQQFFGV